MNGQHKSGREGRGDLPQPRLGPRIGKVGSGGIQMGRWRTLWAVGVAVAVALLLAGCQRGEQAAGDVRQGPAGSGAMRVVMEDSEFRPEFRCTWHQGMVGRIVAT
ncbi:MAG TPA: hypothetical protein VFA46_01070 [Actinomycetes bacterium]|nr:hypothetical protein [Actinomycetes bacterium]